MARTRLICTWQGSLGGNMPLPFLGSWKLSRLTEKPVTALILMRKRTHKWQCGCKLGSVPPLIPKVKLTLIPRHQARRISLEEPTVHVTSEARCGGSAPKGELTSRKHRNLVKPAFCRLEACAPDPAARFRSLRDLDQLGHEAVMSKLADSM